MEGLSWMCLFFNHPAAQSQVGPWLSSAGSGEAEALSPEVLTPCPCTANVHCKRLCFSCRGSPDVGGLDGEVDPSLNDSLWA